MLDLAFKSFERLNNPDVKVEDKLFLISRFMEEKYGFDSSISHWDDQLNRMLEGERIFYKTWLWLNYFENEQSGRPVPEFEMVIS